MFATRYRLWGAAALVVLSAQASPAGAAVVAPYTNDFTSSASDFTPTGSWTLSTAGTGTYTDAITAADTANAAMVQVTNLGGSTDASFQLFTRFSVNSYSGTSTTVGFSALAADNNSADASGTHVLADVSMASAAGGFANLRIITVNPNDTATANPATFPVLLNTPYTLTLTGTYAGNGDLTMQLSLADVNTPANTASVTRVYPDASVPAGQFFGFRNRAQGAGSALNVSFDSFSVTAVPEPAALGLFAAAAAPALLRRRRSGR